MSTKNIYYKTVHTEVNGVVLLPVRSGVVETYCVGKNANNKKINMPTFDGFYLNKELSVVR